MSNNFIPLDCDDDVVLFQQDTFKISRLKELLRKITIQKLDYYVQDRENKNLGQVDSFFRQIIIGTSSIGETYMPIDEFQFHSTQDCQLLQLGGKGWQKGKLKIQISVPQPTYTNRQKYNVVNVHLEFSPDELEEPKLSLDDLQKTAVEAEQ
jgi:KGK domain